MAGSKTRKKKYDSGKVSRKRISMSFQSERDGFSAYEQLICSPFQFDLSFRQSEMSSKFSVASVEAGEVLGRLGIKSGFPYDLICGVFDYNPMVVVFMLNLIELPEYWDAQFEISYLDPAHIEAGYECISFQKVLPSMTLSQAIYGNTSKYSKKVYIEDKSGIKTAWMGLNKESERLTSKSELPSSYVHVMTHVYLGMKARFKDAKSYKTFLNICEVREKKGVEGLKYVLRQVWLDEVGFFTGDAA